MMCTINPNLFFQMFYSLKWNIIMMMISAHDIVMNPPQDH